MRTKKIQLGMKQTLEVIQNAPMGVFLAIPGTGNTDKVLLPKNQVPPETKLKDSIEVFIYRDSEDRLIATTLTPFLMLDQIAVLEVVQITSIGAFLNWGLAKDLFLPFKEQTYRVNVGDHIPVSLYIDKSDRLCATMHLYDKLSSDSPYQTENEVTGIIYEIIENMGAFVVIDNQYSALIPKTEICRKLKVGETLSARVKEVREDGKLTLSLRQKMHLQINTDASLILERLEQAEGFLPFHDKTPSDIIRNEFHMSKNSFKRAVGRLLKEGKITISEKGISLI